jgi:hypothetical protein
MGGTQGDAKMPDSDLLTERETAEVRRCSTRKLQRDRAEGRGCPYVRIDGRIFYRRKDVDQYVAAHVCGGERGADGAEHVPHRLRKTSASTP